VFGNWLCDMAAADKRLVGITPAMREGSGMVRFEQQFPDRYFDVGIAEQHSVTFAGGLATEGLKPVVAIYSTFLQRAYDQLIHDVALQNLDVTFALDRAGLVGADGATHAGNYDMAYLRCIPNMVVMAASDENECRQMLTTGYHYDGPAAVRYPRGAGIGAAIEKELTSIEIGKGEIKRKARAWRSWRSVRWWRHRVAAGNELNATVANMRFVKPLDVELVKQLAVARLPGDGGRGLRHGRRRFGGGRGAGRGRHRQADADAGPAGQVHRPWRPGGPAGRRGLDAKGIAASIRQRFGAAPNQLKACRVSQWWSTIFVLTGSSRACARAATARRCRRQSGSARATARTSGPTAGSRTGADAR
jgi:1-deoxy-D-xylulose-5-phosphate synthase